MDGMLPSIILTQCLNKLPAVLRLTSVYQGIPTKSEIDRSTTVKYFFFLVFNGEIPRNVTSAAFLTDWLQQRQFFS